MKSINQIKREEMALAIIKLKDCYVTRIEEDEIEWRGCDTCDYGSRYGIEYLITFSDSTNERMEICEMYSSPVSQGDLMRFILNNYEEFALMTKDEFMDVLRDTNKVLGY